MIANASRLSASAPETSPLVARAHCLTLILMVTLSACRPGQETSQRHVISRSPEHYEIRSPAASTPKTITIRNLGDEIVVDPRIVVNGRKNWFSTDSILEEILEPGMSKRDKALAIWRFVVDNRYHDQPVHHHVETHDPVRLFNVYGYGFCDDAATNFMVLAEKARLTARVWTLGGHVVAEALYDGAWHMFDADAEVYYPMEDGTIAGVEQLANDPDLIRRYPSPLAEFPAEDLIRIYSTRDNNRVAGWYRVNSSTQHLMTFSLRPAESVMRSRDNWGLFVASRAGTEPPVYGNGRFTFEPVPREGLFRLGVDEVVGVTEDTSGGEAALTFVATPGGDEARVTYPFVSPYPILSARVRIQGELRGDGDAWLDYSEDGYRRLNLWTTSEASEIDIEIPLDSQLRRNTGRPVYSYLLTLGLTANAADAEWRVDELRFESDFQLAPQSLPELDAGVNEVLYVDSGAEGSRQVEVIFNHATIF